jgi:hypothetical protein
MQSVRLHILSFPFSFESGLDVISSIPAFPPGAFLEATVIPIPDTSQRAWASRVVIIVIISRETEAHQSFAVEVVLFLICYGSMADQGYGWMHFCRCKRDGMFFYDVFPPMPQKRSWPAPENEAPGRSGVAYPWMISGSWVLTTATNIVS